MKDILVDIAVALAKVKIKPIGTKPNSLIFEEFCVQLKDNLVSVHYNVNLLPHIASSMTVLVYDAVRESEGYLFATGSVYDVVTDAFGNPIDVIEGVKAIESSEETKRQYYIDEARIDKYLQGLEVDTLHTC